MQQITRDHPCRSMILIKLLWNFIEIALRRGCAPVNLLHLFRTPFPMNTYFYYLVLLLLHDYFCNVFLPLTLYCNSSWLLEADLSIFQNSYFSRHLWGFTSFSLLFIWDLTIITVFCFFSGIERFHSNCMLGIEYVFLQQLGKSNLLKLKKD